MEFNACGEQSSFGCTYTKVPLRTLGELPKLTTQDKKKMMGSELEVPLVYPEASGCETLAADGVPFAWAESKPVGWWATFFKDMHLDHIFDTTPGSAAAAIGAFYAGVQYDAVCCNPMHKNFLDLMMNQAMFAVLAAGCHWAPKEHVAKVMHFFGPAVDYGMRMIRAADAATNDGTGEDLPQVEPEDDNADQDSDDFE